jgi:ubiquinone/menaquinone biosynthesis C-methylase UbiE
MKQWSLKSVFDAHNYNLIKENEVHLNFKNWIIDYYGDMKIKVVDIGGGNGRVCLSIDKSINEYWCLDINDDNIKTGKEFFKTDKRINFLNFDIDESELDIECDVVYIDSVLTMIEEPFDALSKFAKFSDFTFVNRTELHKDIWIPNHGLIKQNTNKTKNIWGGMSTPSTLWSFSYNSILDFCNNNNLELIIIDNYTFVIKNNK